MIKIDYPRPSPSLKLHIRIFLYIMDKVFHFQTQKGKAGHLQQVISSEQKLQFYSEEEFDSANDTP